MSASRVHAVIAAGLENPELFARWRREPDLLRDLGVDPASFDFDSLLKFAGLTAKVRHNGLRADLPLTFRLLNIAGLEIEVFTAYAGFRASTGGHYAAAPQERARDLLGFLDHWVDFNRREHLILWDVIRYELALMKLGQLAAAGPAPIGEESFAHSKPRAGSIPRVRGDIVLHEMRSDPRMTGEILQQKIPRLEEVPIGDLHLCFWLSRSNAGIQILELDELGFYLLSLADGRRSSADLSRLLGCGSRPSKAFLGVLGELREVGILTFSPNPVRDQ